MRTRPYGAPDPAASLTAASAAASAAEPPPRSPPPPQHPRDAAAFCISHLHTRARAHTSARSSSSRHALDWRGLQRLRTAASRGWPAQPLYSSSTEGSTHLRPPNDKCETMSGIRVVRANGWAAGGDLGRDLHLRKHIKRIDLVSQMISSTMSFQSARPVMGCKWCVAHGKTWRLSM